MLTRFAYAIVSAARQPMMSVIAIRPRPRSKRSYWMDEWGKVSTHPKTLRGYVLFGPVRAETVDQARPLLDKLADEYPI